MCEHTTIVVNGTRNDYEVYASDSRTTCKGHVERITGYRAKSRAIERAHELKKQVDDACWLALAASEE